MKQSRNAQILVAMSALTIIMALPLALIFKYDEVKLSAKNDPGIPTLKEQRENIRAWALSCMGVAAKENCDVGDGLLFNGILCLSGELFACAAVKNSQSPDGRVWRAPIRVGYENPDSFSRDMALGALAYIVATGDGVFAQNWLQWIQTHNGRLCLLASDNRCDFTPGLWDLFGQVWSHIGLTPSPEMSADLFDDSIVQVLQARVAPVGYSLHLVAVDLLIRKSFFGVEKNKHYKGNSGVLLHNNKDSFEYMAADILAERQPMNPFYLFLRDGPTPQVRALTHALCPTQAPELRKQWFLERDTSEQAWKEAMGWDCVALLNLVLKIEHH